MRVPQGHHEDFKFLGISNTSRQDFEQLRSSIDCISPFFFYERTQGKSAAPGQLSIVSHTMTVKL